MEVPQIPSEEQVRDALAAFQGIISQRPPIFSALKIGGRSAYKLARAKKQVELSERPVEAKVVELIRYEWPFVDVRLVTGPGFYVRSFGRDLGRSWPPAATWNNWNEPRGPVHEGNRPSRCRNFAGSPRGEDLNVLILRGFCNHEADIVCWCSDRSEIAFRRPRDTATVDPHVFEQHVAHTVIRIQPRMTLGRCMGPVAVMLRNTRSEIRPFPCWSRRTRSCQS